MDLVSHDSRYSNRNDQHHLVSDFLTTCNKVMMELVLVLGIGLISLLCVYFLLARDLAGSKCISEKPYKSKKGVTRTALRARRNWIN